MTRQKKQVGGRKEAPLEVVGNEAYGSDQPQIYVPTDAEYAYYGELLQGFFEKLTRWQEIFKEFQYNIPRTYGKGGEMYGSKFIVVQTPDGIAIRNGEDLPSFPKRPDIVVIGHTANIGDFSEGYFLSDMNFKPPGIGNRLLVDADGKDVQRVQIFVNSRLSQLPEDDFFLLRKLDIHAIRANSPDTPKWRLKDCHVKYQFQDDTLHVIRVEGITKPMSDAYAIHLFNSIDALIPGATSPTPRSERRATPELRAPRPLPAPRRRTPGRP